MISRALRLSTVAGIAAASVLSITGATAAGAAPVPRADWHGNYYYEQDDGDAGGRSITDTAESPDGLVSVEFRALGEHLYIWDHYDNGRDTVARLWVGGSGPAVYYGNGYDTLREITSLSYDEGQSVYVQVCTSDHPDAVCTDKAKYRGVS